MTPLQTALKAEIAKLNPAYVENIMGKGAEEILQWIDQTLRDLRSGPIPETLHHIQIHDEARLLGHHILFSHFAFILFMVNELLERERAIPGIQKPP